MPRKKKEVSEETQLLDVLIEARRFWRKESYQNYTTEHEDRNFRQSFGCGANIVHIVWLMLLENDLIPAGGCILYLLWALMFLKDYGKERNGSGITGSCPKTVRKWIWPFIWAVSSLETLVVRMDVNLMNATNHTHEVSLFLLFR